MQVNYVNNQTFFFFQNWIDSVLIEDFRNYTSTEIVFFNLVFELKM